MAADAIPWAGFAFLAVLLAGAALVVRRKGGGGLSLPAWRAGRAPASELVRLGAQPLTPQASLHVVRWNGEELLLGCGPQQVTLLARRPVGEEGAR